jgi:hypothetical protein
VFEKINQTLMAEIPRLIDLRAPFLNPVFESMVKCQKEFNSAAFKRMDGIRGRFDDKSSPASSNASEVLNEIRSLTICAN